MAESGKIQYTVEVLADVKQLRKSIESQLKDLSFGISTASISEAKAKIQEKLVPKLSFTANLSSIRTMKAEIQNRITELGGIKVKLGISNAKTFEDQVKGLSSKIEVDLKIKGSARQFQKAHSSLTELAKAFDSISVAKDKFATNVDSKLPRISGHFRSLSAILAQITQQTSNVNNY